MRTFILLSATLCSGCANIEKAYIEADAATYRAVAPEYAAYLREDETLDKAGRATRLDTLALWALRIRAHGGAAEEVENAGK